MQQEEDQREQTKATNFTLESYTTPITEAKSNYTCQLLQGELKSKEKCKQESKKMPQPAEVEQDISLELADALRANREGLADGLRVG